MLVIALLYLTYKEAVGKPLTLSSATVNEKETFQKVQVLHQQQSIKGSNWNLRKHCIHGTCFQSLPPISTGKWLPIERRRLEKKILINIQVPSNMKVPQKLDEYILELLQEGKKAKTLSFEKTLKGIQDKVVLTLAPLTKLMRIIEEEKNSCRLMNRWRAVAGQ